MPALDSLTVECGFDNGGLFGKVTIFSNDPLLSRPVQMNSYHNDRTQQGKMW